VSTLDTPRIAPAETEDDYRQVRELIAEYRAWDVARTAELWDGRDQGGHEVPHGIHLATLATGTTRVVGKLVKLR
jgi:hypothetical protein